MSSVVRRADMPSKIKISVIVTTRNEEKNLPRCLRALEVFDEIIVVDSGSMDATREIARSFGACVIDFSWDGQYPKKRQWCLDTLPLRNERVFFVDADEELSKELIAEIAALDWQCAGYFVKGRYVLDGKPMRYGIENNKLCLFDRRLIEFPVVNDLDIPSMGEMEGHYQPVSKKECPAKIGRLRNSLYHHAFEDACSYKDRHESYAAWEVEMRARQAYPAEDDGYRKILKAVFLKMPLRAECAFAHSYFFKRGFLDGKRGLIMASSRYRYYARVRKLEKERRAAK